MKLPELPPWLETILRVVQFGSAIASLIIWAIYLSNLGTGQTSSMKAVLGIVVAGTIWTLSAVLQWAWKHRQAKKGKAAWGAAVGIVIAIALVDFLFIILFAAVAGITGPAVRGQGACTSGDDNDNDNGNASTDAYGCGQNKAVFGLAIVNIFSFSGSSIMNAIQSTQRPPNPKSMYKSGKHVGGAVSDNIAS